MAASFAIDSFCDGLGPEMVIHVADASLGLRGIVVIDNTACGPALGGVRMAPDVTLEEVLRLSRAMTMKNAAAGLPHGGGKAGILADPRRGDRLALMRTFARAIRQVTSYIPGPDMGTDETCMAIIHDETGRAVGLPRVLGGIPLDEIGATGFGLAKCAEVAAPFCDLRLPGATLAIEGFGNVGRPVARFLGCLGVRLVAASDSQGSVHNPEGFDVDRLARVKRETGSVVHYAPGRKIDLAELFTVPCDILIPAARPDCIHADNAKSIQAKMILEGANIPTTPEAETILHERGILVVPDFIANAGGVICASVEYHQGAEAMAFQQIKEKICTNTEAVLRRSLTCQPCE